MKFESNPIKTLACRLLTSKIFKNFKMLKFFMLKLKFRPENR